MATHELYLGGPPSRNYGLSMFPARPFNEATAPFNTIGPAAHKGSYVYKDTRRLDFSGDDHALAEFLRENVVAQADVLGAVLIPKDCLLLGFHYRIIKAKAGVTLTPKFRGKAHTFAAIDGSVDGGNGFYPASGAAVAAVTEGVASLALAVFDNKPDMLDLTLTAVPAGGIGGFAIDITPIFVHVADGGIP